MSAFIIVDMTPLNVEKLQQYGAAAASTLVKYQGEYVVKGAIQSLTADNHYEMKVVIQFPDKEMASKWYHSDEYQALITLRQQAMESVFHLVG
jgi:uncharacterized protein (DUF1330 family)